MASQESGTLPQPPFFKIDNINNLRDAALIPGGLVTASGDKLRTGILYRAAEPSKLDNDGWATLRKVGVNHLFDLRSLPELEKSWKGIGQRDLVSDSEGNVTDARYPWIDDLEATGLKRTWVPVFKAADYSPERLVERYIKYMDHSVEGFVAAYKDILQNAGPAYRTILQYLINLPPPEESSKEPIGALIHCTAGKDRTGIFFGILFSYLGVSDERIAEEYNLTEAGLAHIQDEVAARLMQSPGFRKYMQNQRAGKTTTAADLADLVDARKGYDNAGEEKADELEELTPEELEIGRQAALRMVGARKESMLHSLKMVEKEFGSAEAYLRKYCGMEDNDLAALRSSLLVVPA